MAGIEFLDMLPLQIGDSFFQSLIHFKQMPTADNAADPAVAADLFSVFDNIAYTAVRTAGDDKKPVFTLIGESRIVHYQVDWIGAVTKAATLLKIVEHWYYL